MCWPPRCNDGPRVWDPGPGGALDLARGDGRVRLLVQRWERALQPGGALPDCGPMVAWNGAAAAALAVAGSVSAVCGGAVAPVGAACGHSPVIWADLAKDDSDAEDADGPYVAHSAACAGQAARSRSAVDLDAEEQASLLAWPAPPAIVRGPSMPGPWLGLTPSGRPLVRQEVRVLRTFVHMADDLDDGPPPAAAARSRSAPPRWSHCGNSYRCFGRPGRAASVAAASVVRLPSSGWGSIHERNVIDLMDASEDPHGVTSPEGVTSAARKATDDALYGDGLGDLVLGRPRGRLHGALAYPVEDDDRGGAELAGLSARQRSRTTGPCRPAAPLAATGLSELSEDDRAGADGSCGPSTRLVTGRGNAPARILDDVSAPPPLGDEVTLLQGGSSAASPGPSGGEGCWFRASHGLVTDAVGAVEWVVDTVWELAAPADVEGTNVDACVARQADTCAGWTSLLAAREAAVQDGRRWLEPPRTGRSPLGESQDERPRRADSRDVAAAAALVANPPEADMSVLDDLVDELNRGLDVYEELTFSDACTASGHERAVDCSVLIWPSGRLLELELSDVDMWRGVWWRAAWLHCCMTTAELLVSSKRLRWTGDVTRGHARGPQRVARHALAHAGGTAFDYHYDPGPAATADVDHGASCFAILASRDAALQSGRRDLELLRAGGRYLGLNRDERPCRAGPRRAAARGTLEAISVGIAKLDGLVDELIDELARGMDVYAGPASADAVSAASGHGWAAARTSSPRPRWRHLDSGPSDSAHGDCTRLHDDDTCFDYHYDPGPAAGASVGSGEGDAAAGAACGLRAARSPRKTLSSPRLPPPETVDTTAGAAARALVTPLPAPMSELAALPGAVDATAARAAAAAVAASRLARAALGGAQPPQAVGSSGLDRPGSRRTLPAAASRCSEPQRQAPLSALRPACAVGDATSAAASPPAPALSFPAPRGEAAVVATVHATAPPQRKRARRRGRPPESLWDSANETIDALFAAVPRLGPGNEPELLAGIEEFETRIRVAGMPFSRPEARQLVCRLGPLCDRLLRQRCVAAADQLGQVINAVITAADTSGGTKRLFDDD